MTGILNHLWQSTAFAALVAFAAWMLRRHSPRVRYWLWLAASLKFLIPFSWLVSTGARVQLPAGAPALATLPAETISTYFAPVSMPAPAIPLQSSFDWALWLGLLWLGGALVLLARRCRQWSRLRRLAHSATPMACKTQIPVFESNANIDPGVFGLIHQVLLLPAGFADALRPAQFEGVLLHELRHVRYRDNLTAALHMGVEIAFWFYPPVWWIGAKLIEERERDCDQAALAQGGSRGEYARCILQVCRQYVGSPLPCAAGISGADLKKRIREIMVWRGSLPLTLRTKMAVAVVAMIAVLVPFGIGIARGQGLRSLSVSAQAALPAQLPSFDVVSVKPFHNNGRPWHRQPQFDPQRLYIEGMSPDELIDLAYSLNWNQLAGLPDWAKNLRESLYSITATTAQPTSKGQMLLMLRRVLAERFQLVLSESDKVQPVYDLAVAKDGPKLQPSHSEKECHSYTAAWVNALHIPQDAYWGYVGCSITELVQRLNEPGLYSIPGNLPVLDKTGLAGSYRVAVWRATDGTEPVPGRPNAFRWVNLEPIQHALKRELGLELVKSKGPYRVLTVQHIARPTAN